jgi:hypothetical protein
MSTRTRHIAIGVVGIFLIALSTGVIMLFGGNTPAITAMPVAGSQQYNVPQNEKINDLELPLVQLEGSWVYKQGSVAFKANVEGQHIAIDMVTDDGSMAYWDGSFKTAESPGNTITSVRTDEVALSQDQTKDFSLDDGELKFEFRAMGVTKIIVLTR